jgi:2-aminoethylphosphonate-pyruvate transaminase
MLRDLGSRDFEFIEQVKYIRQQLLRTGGVSTEAGYESVIMQGSGTFGIESVISSVVPADGHLLVIINGVYGERISRMAEIHHIRQSRLVFAENEVPDLAIVKEYLDENSDITHVAVIHCETTTGIINPIHEIGQLCAAAGKVYIVDAMSSFGAYPVDLAASGIHFLISSSNKCIEGVPGFSFVIADRAELMNCKKNTRTLSLDLYDQWKGLELSGQFRFTPPTHALLAFAQALKELEQEGGVAGRAARYQGNYIRLSEGMKQLGFREYLEPAHRGYIITCFHYPADPVFDFHSFYEALNEKGFVIYPGKLSKVDCFRIGNIGHITEENIQELLQTIEEILAIKAIQMHNHL